MPKPIPHRLCLELPAWVRDLAAREKRHRVTPEEKMGLAVSLARENVEHATGGPFGAAVFFADSHEIVSLGVNLVVPKSCSAAHAEIVALSLAQQQLRTFDLGSHGPVELWVSAQPCIQCYGAIWWSGVSRVVVGASGEDVERLTGFREGPVPGDWKERLGHRPPLPPIAVEEGVLLEEAKAVLARYGERGGPVYNPTGAEKSSS